MKTLTTEEIQKKRDGLRNMSDVANFAKELVAPIMQEMLEAEMSEHLGYKKNSVTGNNTGNSRNGYSTKKLKGSFGAAEIEIPRDRNGEFEPVALGKYETVDNDLEERIISMYGKGMSTRDIESHIKDIYGVSVSSGMVSNITDKILPLVREWQHRPLNKLYCVVYLDGVHFKVREGGKIVSKCAYIILGITKSGHKEILGIYIGENEGAKHWLQTLNELKNRGVEDILIACIDGLKGFSEAIKAVFPNTDIQKCIVHQIRNTTKYIPHKDKKAFCADLRTIYTAASEEEGFSAIETVEKNWPKYAPYLQSWRNNWSDLSTFFLYPEAVRRIIYTTNAVESLNRQLRKVTKTSCVFPHDTALIKLLYLAQEDISKKWLNPIHNWGEIMAQFSIFFPDRIKL